MPNDDDDEPRRYTLDEALAELTRRDCAHTGHEPDLVLRSADGWPVSAYCKCRRVLWTPSQA